MFAVNRQVLVNNSCVQSYKHAMFIVDRWALLKATRTQCRE